MRVAAQSIMAIWISFIRRRVERLAEIGHHIEAAGDRAVKHVGHGAQKQHAHCPPERTSDIQHRKNRRQQYS